MPRARARLKCNGGLLLHVEGDSFGQLGDLQLPVEGDRVSAGRAAPRLPGNRAATDAT